MCVQSMNTVVGSDAIECNASDSNAFISKLLGEMKSQFNRTDKKDKKSEETQTDIVNETEKDEKAQKAETVAPSVNGSDAKCETKSDDSSEECTNNTQKLDDVKTDDTGIYKEEVEAEDGETESRNVLLFKKPHVETSNKSKTKTEDFPVGRRSLRNKSNSTEAKTDEAILKRSTRRRSKDCNESVLQSAIARKEKSYNESSKPQRLTRQLKPTQKILENLAVAEKTINDKNKSPKRGDKNKYDSDSNNESLDNVATDNQEDITSKSKTGRKHVKRLKLSYSDNGKDSDSDIDQQVKTGDIFRRSQRISVSRSKDDLSIDLDESPLPEPKTADHSTLHPADPECSSVTAQLIQSRLCLCTQTTRLFPASQEETVYCRAVDSVGEKLVGCTKTVSNDTPLLRPSCRVPYMVLCEVHINRLIRHNCCPTCGVFCTQGRFAQCESRHQYHRDCQISVGDIECCPHCGELTPKYDVYISMHSPKKPIFLPTQIPVRSVAKLSFGGCSYSRTQSESKTMLVPLLPQEIIELLNASELEGQIFDATELSDAIHHNDLERLAIILGSRSVDLLTKLQDCDEGTALHLAAHKGLILIVHMLITVGMDIDIFDKEQNTPLMLAILAEKNDVVKYLIRAGASIDIKGTDGMTSLHLAAKCGNLQACEMVINSTFDMKNIVNSQDDGGWTPLVWACEHGYVDVAKYLIRNGADPSMRDVEHNVALHWAAFSGSCDIVEILSNNGCDVNSINAHGDTPLHIASRQDMYNCVVMLLARGANVSIINKNNESPLDCVPPDSQSLNIISLNYHLQAASYPVYNQHKFLLTKFMFSSDISRGRELNPIQCLNTVDDEPKPTDFVYVTKNCFTNNNLGIDLRITSIKFCTCEERCMPGSCSCIQLEKPWYDTEGRLSADFDYSDPPSIYECNEACSCNSIICSNRVVQKGLTQRFQLFKTTTKGWGIRTLRFVAKGTFVCEYIGEVLSEADADQREDDSYLFDLDQKGDSSFCIDARFFGNLARFINHSCEPNLIPIKTFIGHQDIRFPRISFFACRDVGMDEELSFDYGKKFWEVKCKSFMCDCGSENCKYGTEVSE